MSGFSQYDFRSIELDPKLLSTSFRMQTNWHIITGAPCSGKTTLIDQLAGMGFLTVPEAGREYVEGEMAKGKTTDEIFENAAVTQRGIENMQMGFERRLNVNEVVFLDRGLPDSLTYNRILGLNPNTILAECFHYRYASVFILDRFPFQPDGTRFEDDTIAHLIDKWLVRDYTALGYNLIRVPMLPPEERVSVILERVSEEELV